MFSYLQKYEDMLIFNEAKKITKYDLTMQTPGTLYIPSTAELPEDTDTAEQLRQQVEDQLQDGKKTYHLIVTFMRSSRIHILSSRRAVISIKQM